VIERYDSSLFTASYWRIGASFVVEFGFECRFKRFSSPLGKRVMRQYAVGWAPGNQLFCRPKLDHVGVMFFKDDRHFWVHLRNAEFDLIWPGVRVAPVLEER